MITLPIYFHTEETEKFEKVDMEFSIKDCEVREVYFFSIQALSEFKENGKVVATRVHFNGDTMLCKLPITEVAKAVKEWKTPSYKIKDKPDNF